MNRRDLLKCLGISIPTSIMLPWYKQAYSINIDKKIATTIPTSLVLIELKGGNDGLNILIPYTDKLYYKKRPSIAIPKRKILTLNNVVGLHPSLKPLLLNWEAGELGWLQGLGYANPERSHFKSIEIWDTGITDKDSEQI